MSSVLVVDDEAAMRHLMTRWVEMTGHSAAAASSADEALDLMAQQSPAVALCDLRMPGRDGLWLAGRIRRDYPDTAVIMATAARDTDPRVAEHSGAVDYLLKPFGRDRLRFALERGFDWHLAAATRREWLMRLNAELDQRRADLIEAVASLEGAEAIQLETLQAFIEQSDPKALAHARRVAALAVKLATALGLAGEELAAVREGALLHDLGKLAMPDAVLRKPASLSLQEKEIIRTHPSIGAEVLRLLDTREAAAEVVQSVNEWYDGRGYPHALRRDGIPLGSRIVAVADAFDSMIHTQIYRDAMPRSDALREILRCADTQFDPLVVSAFLELQGDAPAPAS